MVMDISSIIKKFEIGSHKCYLKIGQDENGKVVYLDLTINKGVEEMRCYEVLMSLANLALNNGCSLYDVADILRGHKFPPDGFVSDNGEGHYYGSICDYIGKYLLCNFCQQGSR